MAGRRLHPLLVLVAALGWHLPLPAFEAGPAPARSSQAPARPPPAADARAADGIGHPYMVSPSDLAPAQTMHGIPRLPLELFARRPDLSSPSLSPDGHYLSVQLADQDSGEHDLAIYDIQGATPKLTSILRMPRHQVPLHVVWTSPTELVIEKGESDGSLDQPAFLGEVISTDIKGRHVRYLYGYDRDRSHWVGASSDQVDRGWGRVVDVHHPGDGHFAMAVTEWDNQDVTQLLDVDSVSGHRSLLSSVDIGHASFITDDAGRPVMAYGTDRDYNYRVFLYQDRQWRPLSREQAGFGLDPLGLAPSPGRIYARYSARGAPYVLVEQNIDGSDRKLLTQNRGSNIGAIEWTARPRQPFAETLATGVPRPHYLLPEVRDAQLYRQLTKLYQGLQVHFINFSDDGRQLLFSLTSDRQPSVYLLLNTETGKTQLLFSTQPKVADRQMAERRPRYFITSDHVQIEAILSLPADYGRHPLPTVLLPHGGPFGISDDWSYDADAQFLANRGYLVVQVNFRGSGGRGPAFVSAGSRHWGDRVQQDMIEVIRQLVAEGSADATRICTYGGSFGGYSAMMTVIRAPGLFKCAIGYDGIYDLAMMYHKGDIQTSHQGRSYLHAAIGDDDELLNANSPDKLAARIKVPVLLIHGEEDQRAPLAQAKAMRAALAEAGNPPQWLTEPHEGHGFYQAAHNLQRLQSIEAFLAKSIGSAGTAPSSGAP